MIANLLGIKIFPWLVFYQDGNFIQFRESFFCCCDELT